jgi:hypothetical protein
MTRPVPVWSILFLTLAARPAPAFAPPPSKPGPDQVVTIPGKVVLLAEALKGAGVEFDAEPVAKQVVIKGEDGQLTPILSDNASRALFQDGRLRNRRAEVQGVRLPGLPYLRVVRFRIEEEGKLRIPEYYCEICSISVRYPQICPCCQAEMVLRMKPETD